ncbi:glycosyltransferase [Kaistia terrae]|uniref:Glycosyltransferase n=1 Tax=Kaistia terrae TaxID=537017 RepID=A0ABW0Q461_9HYPH|nr:glycosyltransferase [Kaistia terrae]MCX5578610.1 glycosyltransferase [Kaistia terrae]
MPAIQVPEPALHHPTPSQRSDPPIRVTQVMAHLSRQSGGVFEAVLGLAPALGDRSRIEVRVLGLDHPEPATDHLVQRGVPTQAFPVQGPSSFGYAPRLGRVLRDAAPDILHVHGLWMYPSIAGMGWSGRPMPYVVSPHGMLDGWALSNKRWKKKLAGLAFETRQLRGAACLHALCASELTAIRSAGLTNPVCVIPNGVEPEPTPRTAAPPLWRRDVPAHASILLFLGRLAPQKGLPDLLRGFARERTGTAGASAPSRNWHLVIAGWGEPGYCDLLRDTARDLGLGDVVHFVGPQFGEEKARTFAEADAFVLPSVSEGLPIAILEAWAAHLPVLMTSRCNLDIGFDASAALRIDPEPASIAAGLQQLFSLSVAQRRQMGVRGAQLVATQFSWPKAAESMEAVYRWILGRGSRPDTVDI